jgi:glycosyltransferase involved in cell wall biosynthesis
MHARSGPTGGSAYENDLESALAGAFPLEVRNVYPGRFRALPGRRLRPVLAGLRDPGWDLTLRTYLPALALGLRRPRGRQVVLVHHLDHREIPRAAVSRRLEALFARALPRADRLVVVAEYWARALAPLAPDLPVTVIHNGFDVDEYGLAADDRRAFREWMGFDDRPLVYLGNCQAAKGVVEAHRALRDSPYQLVTSGRRGVELPVPNLQLSARDYRSLLAASDVVLAFSRFLEGWNRTAHEALLAGTPVVGRPRGGLAELLAGAGQTTVEAPEDLPRAVAAVLADRRALGERGRAFARRFTRERFVQAWVALVEEELAALGDRTPAD